MTFNEFCLLYPDLMVFIAGLLAVAFIIGFVFSTFVFIFLELFLDIIISKIKKCKIEKANEEK